MAESKKPVLNRIGKLNIHIMSKLYHQEEIGAVYIHLDGGLRHIPNPQIRFTIYLQESLSLVNLFHLPMPQLRLFQS